MRRVALGEILNEFAGGSGSVQGNKLMVALGSRDGFRISLREQALEQRQLRGCNYGHSLGAERRFAVPDVF